MDRDIIIPVWNQLTFTKDCIDSILKNTDSNVEYRLIMIDNASDSRTAAYLETLKSVTGLKVLVLRNENNLGFVKAVNQGIKASSAPYLCILNNDTLVAKDWLKIMVDVAKRDKNIGIVNPSSNNLGQRPDKGEPVEFYAGKIAKDADKFVELGAAIGFCMLIKKDVIDRIGLFDEIYGMGNFEDTDYSRRAIKEGYKCVRACGAYVYHRENSSFRTVKTFDDDFRRNKEIFEFRWGKPKRVAYTLDSYDVNILLRLKLNSLRLARGGDWVWYFEKGDVDIPEHSNIRAVKIFSKRFYIDTVLKILTKKKKFDEIFVGGERFGKVLEALSFIHKAKVSYY